MVPSLPLLSSVSSGSVKENPGRKNNNKNNNNNFEPMSSASHYSEVFTFIFNVFYPKHLV